MGYNHHFGHNKEGDHSFLVHHRALEVVEVAQYRAEGNKVSSTVIRKTIESGDMALARQLLGHPYIIIGMADEQGVVATDFYKLLPSDGTYAAQINGVVCDIEVRSGRLQQSRYFSQKIEIAL